MARHVHIHVHDTFEEGKHPRGEGGQFSTHEIMHAQPGVRGHQRHYKGEHATPKEAVTAARKALPLGGGWSLKRHVETTPAGQKILHK